MIIFFILGLALGAFAVVFALQNVATITVSFFSWQLQGSLALILLLAALVGILFTLLIFLPSVTGNYFKYKKLKKANKQLEEELRKQKELTAFAAKPVPTPEELHHIEQSAVAQEPGI